MSIRRLFEWPFLLGCAALAVLAGFALPSSGASAKTATFQGVLIDKECSVRAETRMVSGANPHLEGGMLWAYTHDKKCLLMPVCRRSGYGVFTYETNKFVPFDAAGDQKALALLQTSKKDDDMRVEVAGEMDGDKIKVTSLKLMP